MIVTKFPTAVRENLKTYVYLYVDPRDNSVFYVGKGKNNRCFDHLDAIKDSDKVARIKQIRASGHQPRIEILKYGLNEKQALLVEATTIDLIGLESLTNAVHGHGCRVGSRATVDDLCVELSAIKPEIIHPVILIKINRLFRPGMSVHEIYDATRSAWKVGKRREKAELAFAVFGGVVREVFEISQWIPAGSSMRLRDENGRTPVRPGRWEFVGNLPDEKIRKRYKGMSVAEHFPKAAQNPIQYVKC